MDRVRGTVAGLFRLARPGMGVVGVPSALMLAVVVLLGWLAYRVTRSIVEVDALRAVGLVADGRAALLRTKLGREREREQGFLRVTRLRCGGAEACLGEAVEGFMTTETAVGATLAAPGTIVGRGDAPPLGALPGPGAGPMARLDARRDHGSYVVGATSGDAAVALRLPTALLDVIFADRRGLGAGGETFLVDRDGYFVTPHRHAGAAGTTRPIDALPMRRCLAGADGAMIAPDYRGVMMFHGFRAVRETGGCIMAHVDYAEAMAPASRLRSAFLGVTLCLSLAVAGWLSVFHRMFARPLRRLTERARGFEAGDFTSPVPATGPEEVRAFCRAFGSMASSIQRSHEGIESQLAITRTVMATASAALFMEDAGGRCAYANPAALAMFGMSLGELTQGLLHDRIHHHRADGRPLPIDECPIAAPLRRAEVLAGHEDVFFCRGGEPFPGRCSARPILRDGHLAGRVVEIEDLTDQKRIQAEREMLLDSERAARGEAERESRLKEEFVATVSHELRTPLNAILGWARLLGRAEVPADKLRKGLGVIDRNAELLSHLVSDLLDTSRITAGKLHVDPRPAELGSIVGAAVEDLQAAAAAKGVALDVALPAAPMEAEVDPGRVQQAVWNLVSNAVKFTPPGGQVSVSLGAEASMAVVRVHDTGEGIDPAFLPHVFDRFRQADASAARQHGGLGLGLAIVKHVAGRHGGAVQAESEGRGKGATFTLTFPLPAAGRACARAAPPSGPEGDLSGATALVVDDEPDALELTQRILEEQGATVVAASSAGEALAALARGRVDVLVSDISMPGMDGYELVRRLRAGPEPGASLPAVALTAYARQADRERALSAGFQAHVGKPIDPTALVAAVLAARGSGTGGPRAASG